MSGGKCFSYGLHDFRKKQKPHQLTQGTVQGIKGMYTRLRLTGTIALYTNKEK